MFSIGVSLSIGTLWASSLDCSKGPAYKTRSSMKYMNSVVYMFQNLGSLYRFLMFIFWYYIIQISKCHKGAYLIAQSTGKEVGAYNNGLKFKCQPERGTGWFSYKIWNKNWKTAMVNLLKNLKPFGNYNFKIQWEIHFF